MPIVELNKPKLIAWLAIGLFVLGSGLNNADAQTVVSISQFGPNLNDTTIDITEGEPASFQFNIAGGNPATVNLRFYGDLGALTGSPSAATRTSGDERLFIQRQDNSIRVIIGRNGAIEDKILAPPRPPLSVASELTFSIPAMDDDIAAEGVRQAFIEVLDGETPGSVYTAGFRRILTINVTDDDVARVSFSQGATGTVNEGEPIELILTQDLVADVLTAVNINFTYDSEDNAFFGDMPMTTTRVEFPVGTVERTISISTMNDNDATADGLLTARIVPVFPLRAGSQIRRTVTVLDNEPKVSITAADGVADNLSVIEGGIAELQLNISPAAIGELTVTLRYVGDVGALLGLSTLDSVGLPDRFINVQVDAGDTQHDFSFLVINDDIAAEGIRIADIVVEKGVGYNVGTASAVAISVEDNDVAEVSFSQSVGTVTEGNPIALIVTKNLVADTNTAVNINFTYEGDFFESTPMTTRVEFPAGGFAMSGYTTMIQTVDDGMAEADGSLIATIEPVSPLVVGTIDSRIVTVLDNEPDVSVTTLDEEGMLSVNEDIGSATLLLTIDPPVDRQLPITLRYTGDVGALDGMLSSVTIPNRTRVVMVPDNVATHAFVVDVIDDQIVAEFTRTANIVVVDGGSYNAGTPDTVKLAVIDDDVATVSFLQSTGTVVEGEEIVLIVTQDLVADTNTAVNIDFEYNSDNDDFFESQQTADDGPS